MKFIFVLISFVLSGCAQMIPGLTQAIDDAVTDEAVSVVVDKAAMQRDTQIQISVDITNNDSKKS